MMDSDVAASGNFWDDHNLASASDVRYWLAVKAIREAVNRRLTGDPDRLFIEAFLRRYQARWPFPRALSVGCGAGELERGVVGLGAVAHCDGIDVSAASLAMAREVAAREAAARSETEPSIIYHQSDAASWLEASSCPDYDLVFFHGSLHHIENLEGALEGSAEALRKRRGLLYVDEYVGPSRNEWDEEDLGFAAGLFRNVLPEDRRTARVWPPIAMEDPTEMIRSSEIPSVVRRYFDPVEAHPYYGNVLMPLVNALRSPALEKPAIRVLIDHAIELESRLAERGLLRPLYTILVGRPKA